MTRPVIVPLLCAVSISACSESVFEHACEHMSEPADSVLAVRPDDVATAPGTSVLHKRYSILIPGVPGGASGSNEGVTKFTPSEAGDHRLLLSAKVPLTVELDGTALRPEESVDAAEGECAGLATAQTFALEAKTYVLRFGPTAAETVDLLLEEAAH